MTPFSLPCEWIMETNRQLEDNINNDLCFNDNDTNEDDSLSKMGPCVITRHEKKKSSKKHVQPEDFFSQPIVPDTTCNKDHSYSDLIVREMSPYAFPHRPSSDAYCCQSIGVLEKPFFLDALFQNDAFDDEYRCALINAAYSMQIVPVWNPYPQIPVTEVPLYWYLVAKISVIDSLYHWLIPENRNSERPAVVKTFIGERTPANFDELLYQVHIYLNVYTRGASVFEEDYEQDCDRYKSVTMTTEAVNPVDMYNKFACKTSSKDYTRNFMENVIDSTREFHEGHLYDITTVVFKTKIFGNYGTKNTFVQMLNKLFPVKCGTKTLSDMIAKMTVKSSDDDLFYKIIQRAIFCTMCGLYRHDQKKIYDFATRKKMYDAYGLHTSSNTPRSVVMKFVKKTLADDLTLRYIIKEYLVFTFRSLPGAHKAMCDIIQWDKYEEMVLASTTFIRANLGDKGSAIQKFLGNMELHQKNIIFKCAKKTFLTVVNEKMQVILTEYMSDIVTKKYLAQKPSATAHGSIGVDKENDCYYVPDAEELHGTHKLSDLFSKMDYVFSFLTRNCPVDIRVLWMMSVSTETITSLINVQIAYEKFPIEKHVYVKMKELLYKDFNDPTNDFPEKEFLIIYRFFQHMYNKVYIYVARLPAQYYQNQIVALNRRSGRPDDAVFDLRTGDIAFCPMCKNVFSFVSTKESNCFRSYGTTSLTVDPFKYADPEKQQYRCTCRPLKKASVIRKNIISMVSTIGTLMCQINMDNDTLYKTVSTAMRKSSRQLKQNNTPENKLLIYFHKLAETYIEQGLFNACTQTQQCFINLIGNEFVVTLPKQKGKPHSTTSYIICPRCGCFTTKSMHRMRYGMFFCGACDNIVYRNFAQSDGRVVTTCDTHCSICRQVIKENESHIHLSHVIDDADIIPYNPYCKNATVPINGNKKHVLEMHICDGHRAKWVYRYVSLCNKMYEDNPLNYRYPLSSVIQTGIRRRWTNINLCENYNEKVVFDVGDVPLLLPTDRKYIYGNVFSIQSGTPKSHQMSRSDRILLRQIRSFEKSIKNPHGQVIKQSSVTKRKYAKKQNPHQSVPPSQPTCDDGSVPVKRGRGRPRKNYPQNIK